MLPIIARSIDGIEKGVHQYEAVPRAASGGGGEPARALPPVDRGSAWLRAPCFAFAFTLVFWYHNMQVNA